MRNAEPNKWGGTQNQKAKAAGRALDLRVIIGRRGNNLWSMDLPIYLGVGLRSAQIVLLQCKNNVRGSCSLVAFAFAQRF